MSKDMGAAQDPNKPRHGQGMGREYNKKNGACFTRIEAIIRAISFSCTEVVWRVQWQKFPRTIV